MNRDKTDTTAISAFLAAAREAIGSSRIFSSGTAEFQRLTQTTLPVERTFAAVIKADTIDQIQQLVRLANDHRVPLYPISTGKNWGYGSALPVCSGCVVLDLSGMNKIVEVNQDSAYAVVEPGVTQGNLYAHIQQNNLPLIVDIHGAGADTSILGNAIERGFGIGTYGDHFGAVCGMEIVLPNGELLRTGFGRFDGARAAGVYKWGVGPYLDGLFTQSNFGIVTKIGIWLQPKPEYMVLCLAQSDRVDGIFDLAGIIRKLHLEDTVRSRINVLSRNRLITIYEQYPWSETGGTAPMSEDVANSIAKRYRIGRWNLMFALFGTKAQVSAAKKRAKELLSPVCKSVVFASAASLRFAEMFSWISPLRQLIPTIRSVMSVYGGCPTIAALGSPYWRNRSIKPSAEDRNPARDNCGLIWYAPIIPLEAEDLRAYISFATEKLQKFGFDFAPTFTAVTARAFDCTTPIFYDREDPADCQRAMDCYRELFETGRSKGFIPYRLGIHSMGDLYNEKDPYCRLVDLIKSSIDPNNIISPGRYSRPAEK